MTDEEFVDYAKFLTNKYVSDESRRVSIVADIEKFGADAAKGIMADICQASGDFEPADEKIVKDIAFNFI